MRVLNSTSRTVNPDVTGVEIGVQDLSSLADIIAVIALGQARHAIKVIASLEGAAPAVLHKDLFRGARGQLQIRGDTDAKREASMYQRDAFLFECISWIMARQDAGDRAFMKDPHISSTTQGLDGLMIELDAIKDEIINATIFEDKCTDYPRDQFRDEVLDTFSSHHSNDRCTDLLANTVSLIKDIGLTDDDATLAAARVLDIQYRTYKASLTVDPSFLSTPRLIALFKGYDGLDNLQQSQRIGAVFPVTGNLREWFQQLADLAIAAVNKFEAETDETHV